MCFPALGVELGLRYVQDKTQQLELGLSKRGIQKKESIVSCDYIINDFHNYISQGKLYICSTLFFYVNQLLIFPYKILCFLKPFHVICRSEQIFFSFLSKSTKSECKKLIIKLNIFKSSDFF